MSRSISNVWPSTRLTKIDVWQLPTRPTKNSDDAVVRLRRTSHVELDAIKPSRPFATSSRPPSTGICRRNQFAVLMEAERSERDFLMAKWAGKPVLGVIHDLQSLHSRN